MKHLVDDVRAAVAGKNWYAALGLALALPDICGHLEAPGDTSRARYARWFDQHVGPRYISAASGSLPGHRFLAGDDCYALRCAYLHQGDVDITSQRARQALDSFLFVVPPPGWTIHCNQTNNKLQLQVDLFCEDLCSSVEKWLAAVAMNSDVTTRIGLLPRIRIATDGNLSF